MQAISSILNTPAARQAVPAGGNAPGDTAGGGGFAAELESSVSAARAAAEKRSEEVRSAAEQLVATTFIMPLFAQLRNDPMASDMFHGGRGEAVFQQQMDQILSDRISTGAGFDLVDTVTAYFEGRPSTPVGRAELQDAARSRYQPQPAAAGEVKTYG